MPPDKQTKSVNEDALQNSNHLKSKEYLFFKLYSNQKYHKYKQQSKKQK